MYADLPALWALLFAYYADYVSLAQKVCDRCGGVFCVHPQCECGECCQICWDAGKIDEYCVD